jgi:diguanylate cyclase (GGDEF)-like protein
VAVVDLDGLKVLNDRLGHAAGDASIRAVARAVRAVVRADDLVFRWGGDEFLVVLEGLAEDEARRRLASLDESLRAAALPGRAQPVALSVSWGVAGFGPDRTLEHAIEAADAVMYARKRDRQSRPA